MVPELWFSLSSIKAPSLLFTRVSVSICHMCVDARRSGEGVGSTGIGLIGGCEPSDFGAEI